MKSLLALLVAGVSFVLVSCEGISSSAAFNPLTGEFEFTAKSEVPAVQPTK